MVKLTADDKKWRAESDARTLMEAEEIVADKTRKVAAIKETKEIIKKAEKTVKTAKKIAGKKTGTKKTSSKKR